MRTAIELMDGINRAAWRARDSVKWFSTLEGWTDPGERVATELAALMARDQPILDLGVGGGRTVPLLRKISRNYTALDYTPELVEACRKKYPDARVLHGDARNLSEFMDASFGLVVFSFNGLDAVNPDDRLTVLREVHRVLRPGGLFLFSSHNQAGPGHRESLNFGLSLTRHPLKLAARLARVLRYSMQTFSNYRRYSRLNRQAEGYSIMNAAAHHHGIVIHYITLDKQLEQLAAAGFSPDPAVFGSQDGQRVAAGDDNSRHMWLHFMAKKA